MSITSTCVVWNQEREKNHNHNHNAGHALTGSANLHIASRRRDLVLWALRVVDGTHWTDDAAGEGEGGHNERAGRASGNGPPLLHDISPCAGGGEQDARLALATIPLGR